MNKKVITVGGVLVIAVLVLVLLTYSRRGDREEPVDTPPEPPIRELLTIEEAREKAAFEILVPGYVPAGFSFAGVQVTEERVMLVYEDEQGRRVIITEWQSDTFEHRPYPGEETVTIDGKEGFFSVAGPYNLLWKCNRTIFSLSADLTGGKEYVKDEMIKIAQSIQC